MATATLPKPRLEDLKPGEVLCDYCPAKCCRYFAMPIDEPETHEDFEYVRWYLLHQGATVFTEDDTWYCRGEVRFDARKGSDQVPLDSPTKVVSSHTGVALKDPAPFQ